MSTLKIPVSEQDHILGPLDAPFSLVEYGDYECPACGLAYPSVKAVQKTLGDNLCFVFRHFPLTEIHPLAGLAASTAEFAAKYDRFWNVHDSIYQNQKSLSQEFLSELVKSQGLALDEFIENIENEVFAEKIRKDFFGGVRSGVNGTPTFFINSQRYTGSFSYDDLLYGITKGKF
ncbi:DsbA family protein (plasmid) [Legionella sp. D16C41]|uniref:DsbA family protein n=1 Tax=Legionella sp. D16C41 TaxID=3402688 RepID=UPI003AF6D435